MQAIKCVVVGDGGIGKTAMLISFANNNNRIEDAPYAYFEYYNTAILLGDTPYNLGLWDTAGQEENERLRALCYPQTDVVLVCFSSINPTSFANIRTRVTENKAVILPS